MMKLHDFQRSVIFELYEVIGGGAANVVLVAPTGSGKTVMASRIVADAIGRGRRVLFLVTINCLIAQTLRSLSAFGITGIGVICAGYPETPDAQVQIASLQTLARRPHLLAVDYDVALFDEAHTSRWFGVADQISARWTIGLTATPFRLSKKQGFGDKFEAAVLAPDMIALTAANKLTPLQYKGLRSPDVSQVSLLGGDFNEKELAKVCNTPHAIAAALDGWQQYAADLRTIAFAVDIKHGHEIVDGLRGRGYTAAIVTGSTKGRQEIFDVFAGDGLQVLVSCNALSTGFDVPNVECGLMLRHTHSRALHMQQVGRVTRLAPGKERGLILDAAGNCERLGFPEAISAALTPEIVLSPGVALTGETPVKECPQCGELLRAAVMECPQCGFIFQKAEKEKESAIGQFEDLKNPAWIRGKGEEEHAEYYRYLIRKIWDNGRCPSTAFGEFCKENFPGYPKPGYRWGRHAIYADNPTDEQLLEYQSKVKRWQRVMRTDARWATWLLTQEFGSKGMSRLHQL